MENERNDKIYCERLGGETYAAIARKYNMNQVRARGICKKLEVLEKRGLRELVRLGFRLQYAEKLQRDGISNLFELKSAILMRRLTEISVGENLFNLCLEVCGIEKPEEIRAGEMKMIRHLEMMGFKVTKEGIYP